MVCLAGPVAQADKVAVLPARGGLDPTARTTLDQELVRWLVAQSHELVPAPKVAAATALRAATDVGGGPEEFMAVGRATGADWVLVGTINPAVATARVELSACLVGAGRTESVAREVDESRFGPEIREMLAVLVRAEGVGAGALPWELPQAAPDAQATPPTGAPQFPQAPEPRIPTHARIAYAMGTEPDVWPVYGYRRGFLTADLGASVPVAHPPLPTANVGSGAALVGLLRAGCAVGDRGFEPFAELGGNLFGPRALWLAAGARWMLAPALRRGADGVLEGVPLFVGPRLSGGVFVELGSQATLSPGGLSYSAAAGARGLFSAALDAAYAVSSRVYLEANLGNLALLAGAGGSTVLAGATVGVTIRF
jgi:hypothetical protein